MTARYGPAKGVCVCMYMDVPISPSNQCSLTGVTKVYGIVHIKEHLLLIGMSSLCGDSRFSLLPYNRK